MIKKELIGLLLILFFVFIAGCDTLLKGGADNEETDFKRTSEGLFMGFVNNYPQERFIVGNIDEEITVVIDVRNKGTYPSETSKNSLSVEEGYFKLGNIHISGFDDEILKFEEEVSTGAGGAAESVKIKDKNSESLSKLFLQPASPINPNGGFDTAEFVGKIIANKIVIDEYEPTILATACYPYFTKASPTICIDPHPFDSRQEKVCGIGTTTLTSQGAPIAVTKVEQEAATGKIQFKIHIKNVGNGDVIWDKSVENLGGRGGLMDRCSPVGGGILNRKDFDRVQLESVKIGSVDLFKTGKCGPFSDGTNNIVKLFGGEGFVICTLNIAELGNIQSAYTTPINVELRYAYRSTISKRIDIRKLEDSILTGGPLEELSTESGDITDQTGEDIKGCKAPTLKEDSCPATGSDFIIFNWNEVVGAEKYVVRWCPLDFSDDNSAVDGLPCDDSRRIPGPSYKITNLDPSTTYRITVFVSESDETVCKPTSPLSQIANCGTTAKVIPDEVDLKCAAPTIPNDIDFRCNIGPVDSIGFNWGVVDDAKEYTITWCQDIEGKDIDVNDPNCKTEKVNKPGKILLGLEQGINFNYIVHVSQTNNNLCAVQGHKSQIGSCATCGGPNQVCCRTGLLGTCRPGFTCDDVDNYCI